MPDNDTKWCATWSRDNAERPAGTAVDVRRFVLVELPLPWPAEIEMHPLLEGFEPVAGTRLQAITGAQACGYRHRIVCYWKSDGEWFARYRRCEREVARPDLLAEVGRLARGEGLEDATSAAEVSDLLLCTHGTRDRCCAKLGGSLFRDLTDHLPDRVRLWRTSHTGGHRFAPTGISFPEGLMWAGLDRDLALGILRRDVPVERAVQHLRGCTGVGGKLQQAAEVEGFARHGWSWWQRERHAVVVDDDGKTATVEIQFRDGAACGSIKVTVERGRTLPIAQCGQPIEAAQKKTTELVARYLGPAA